MVLSGGCQNFNNSGMYLELPQRQNLAATWNNHCRYPFLEPINMHEWNAIQTSRVKTLVNAQFFPDN